MEFGLSHVVTAAIAFAAGYRMRRKPDPVGPSRATMAPAVGATPDVSGPGLAERIFKIVFIGAWLVGWTVGVVMAAGFWITTLKAPGFHTLFVGAWLVAAVAAWVWVGVTWVRMVMGHPDAFRTRT